MGSPRGRLHTALRQFKSRIRKRHLRAPSPAGVGFDVADLPYMGFGATVAWLHMAQVASDALRAPLQVTRPAGWPFGGGNDRCALDRFLEVPVVDSLSHGSIPLAPADKRNLAAWGYYDERSWSGCLFGHVGPGHASLESYRRAVLARGYRPTAESVATVADRLDFLPPRYIAWHIRRGDKTSGPAKEDDAVGLERYVQATARMIDSGDSPRHLVVCSDSPDVIEESRGAARQLGLELVVDERERRWDGYCALHRGGAIQDPAVMEEEVFTAQKIIEIFRRAHALVGCNSSYLFRVGALLQPAARAVSLSENKKFRPYFPL